MRKIIPLQILLVGAGHFGRAHLFEWLALADEGLVDIVGVIVKTQQSKEALEEQFSIPVYMRLTSHLLDQADAVDIVTPADTHEKLIRRCLPHAHVLCEKPVTGPRGNIQALVALVNTSRYRLMIGHIYRFHPLLQKLTEMVSSIDALPTLIRGSLTNPPKPGIESLDINLEFLHLFDMLDVLLGNKPKRSYTTKIGQSHRISLQYQGGTNADLTIGWSGVEPQHLLQLQYPDQKITANFADNAITVESAGFMKKTHLPPEHKALATELRHFVDSLQKQQTPRPDIRTAQRIHTIACSAKPKAKKNRRPKVAIVGGGIFGITCALELSRFCDTQIMERHSSLLTEASYLNQWRHHSGFHYPRSYETVQEIQATKQEFEEVYGDTLVRDFPSYYCTSASGIEIPSQRYLAACKQHKLSFTRKAPPKEILDRSKVSLCLETDEAIIDIDHLQTRVERQLEENKSIKMILNASVIGGQLLDSGGKTLRFRHEGHVRTQNFDYVINATYANSNLISRWFGFPIRPLRFDVMELAVIRLPISRISVTILDAPFTSLVSMGKDNLFMLSHIHESLLASIVTENGLPPRFKKFTSNYANLLKHCRRYLPVLDKAEYVESRYGIRTVYADSNDFDGRPTVVTDHGFGCYSVLGGKIVTSVNNAREIASNIKIDCGIDIA